MAIPSYPITTFIPGSACIGDSRTTLNANFSALDFNLTSLNTSVSTASLSARFITLAHSPFNDGTNPNLFIGEVGDGSTGSVLGSLSGFNTYYDENSNKYIISTQFGTTSPLTALAITQTAQVGINTASPNQALTVSGNVSATGLVYAAGLVYATNTFTGNVGINTTSPNQALTVVGNVSAANNVYASNLSLNSPSRNSIAIQSPVGGGTNDISITRLGGTGGTEDGAAGDGSSIMFQFLSGSSNQINNAALIQHYSNNLQFFNYTGGTTWNERMRIGSNGNVGIGSTATTNQLTIAGTTVPLTIGTGVQSASSYAVNIYNTGGGLYDLTLGSDVSGSYIQSFNAKPLYIQPAGNPVSIGSPGRILSPTGGLTVYGTISATGAASVSALQINNSTTQTTLLSTLTTTRKFPIYDATGTLLGFIPICSF